MDEEESLNRAKNEIVEIVPYDSSWPLKFELEKKRLNAICPNKFLNIEHVGSTAIPECPAKPIIDILATVDSLKTVDELLPVLCDSKYSTSAEFNETLKTSRWLMLHDNGHRTHHLHIVISGSKEWSNKIRFRDILRKDKELANRYVALKLDLAKKMGTDREKYTEAKTRFVTEVLERAG